MNREKYSGLQRRMENLSRRCARLEMLVAVLAATSALSLLTSTDASIAPAQPPQPVAGNQHGSYCSWQGEENLFFTSHLARTPTFSQFQRFCEEKDGDLRWRP